MRRFAVPTARGKRVDTYGFYPLNSRFPLFRSLAQTRERRPLRKRGTAEDLFCCRGAQCAPISLPLRSARFLAATQVVQSTQARHNRVAQLFCAWYRKVSANLSVGCDLSSQVLSKISGLTNCAALLCRTQRRLTACVAVRKQLERLRKRNGRTQRSALRKRNRTLVPL